MVKDFEPERSKRSDLGGQPSSGLKCQTFRDAREKKQHTGKGENSPGAGESASNKCAPKNDE